MEKIIRNTLYNYIKKGVLTSDQINTLTDDAIKIWYKKWWKSEYSPSGRFPISSKLEQRFESNPIKSIETILKYQSENETIESITAKLSTGKFKINLSQNSLNKYSNAYLKKIGGINKVASPFKKDTGEYRKKSLKYKYNASDFKPVKVNVKDKTKKKPDSKSPLEELDKLKKIKAVEEKTTKELLQDVLKTGLIAPSATTTLTVPSSNALQLNTIYNEVFSQKMFGKKNITLDNIKLDNEIIPISYIPEKIKTMSKKVSSNNIVSLKSYKSDIQKLIDIVKLLEKSDTNKRVLNDLNQQLTEVDNKIDKLNSAYVKDADEEEVDKLVIDYSEKTTVDPSSSKRSIYSPLQIAELYEAMNKIPNANKQLMSKLIDLLQYTNGNKLTEQESLDKLQAGIDEFNKKYKRKFDKKMENDIKNQLSKTPVTTVSVSKTSIPVAPTYDPDYIPPKQITQKIKSNLRKLETIWDDIAQRKIITDDLSSLLTKVEKADPTQARTFRDQLNAIITKNQKADTIKATQNIPKTPEQAKQIATELISDENFVNQLQESTGLLISNKKDAIDTLGDIVVNVAKNELTDMSRNRLDSLVQQLVATLSNNPTQDEINNLVKTIKDQSPDLSDDEISKVVNSYLITKPPIIQQKTPIEKIENIELEGTNLATIRLNYFDDSIKIESEDQKFSIQKLNENETIVDFFDLYEWVLKNIDIFYNILQGDLKYIFEYQCRGIYILYCNEKNTKYNLRSFYVNFINVLFNVKNKNSDKIVNTSDKNLRNAATKKGSQSFTRLFDSETALELYNSKYTTIPETQGKLAAKIMFFGDIRYFSTYYLSYYLNAVTTIPSLNYNIYNINYVNITTVFLNILFSKSPLTIIITDGLMSDINLPTEQETVAEQAPETVEEQTPETVTKPAQQPTKKKTKKKSQSKSGNKKKGTKSTRGKSK